MDAKNNNVITARKRDAFFLVLILVVLYSCASLQGSDAEKIVANDSRTANDGAGILADSQEASLLSNSTEITPPRIVESCKDEPYAKYEKQSRASLKKGFNATKEGIYGVGFRDLKEHKRWVGIHEKLFSSVNKACGSLSKCAKNNKKDKSTRCVVEAMVFNEWQAMAERFAKKSKMVETTQPDKICSFSPDLADNPLCFHGLADNIDKVCNKAECKEVSDCWRGIGFLDTATKQAAQACGFVFKKLSDCRGYTDATSRRVKKFEQCKEMQKSLNIVKFPSL